jgi:hypothetical protein
VANQTAVATRRIYQRMYSRPGSRPEHPSRSPVAKDRDRIVHSGARATPLSEHPWVLDRDAPALQLNTNENPFNWLPAVMILIAGMGVFRLHRTRPGASLVLVTAAILVIVAIDDTQELHYGVPYWPIIYLPLFSIVGWTLWSQANASLPPTRQMLKAGLGLLQLAG